jgi:hypothetical protein
MSVEDGEYKETLNWGLIWSAVGVLLVVCGVALWLGYSFMNELPASEATVAATSTQVVVVPTESSSSNTVVNTPAPAVVVVATATTANTNVIEATPTNVVIELPTAAAEETASAVGSPTEEAQVVVELTTTPDTQGSVTSEPVEVPAQATDDLPTLTVAIANFPSYYNAILIAEGIAEKWGFHLNLINLGPEDLGGKVDWDENQQAEALRSGQIDCLFTTYDTFGVQGNYGQNTLVIDQSRGADLVVATKPNLKFNDLKGQPIAATLDSVSQLFAIALFDAIGENPGNPLVLNLLPNIGSAEDALAAYLSGQAQVMIGWVPVVYEGADGNIYTTDAAGNEVFVGYKVIGSENVPVLADGGHCSYQAITQKTDLLQNFHYAWFDALKQMFGNPEQAAQTIAQWDAKNNGWTGVDSGETLIAYMEGIAQANLDQNYILMQNHKEQSSAGKAGTLANFIAYDAELWRKGGKSTQSLNPIESVNPIFVLNVISNHPELRTDGAVEPPLYTAKPFILSGGASIDPSTVTGISQEDVIANLPTETFNFQPNSGILLEESDLRFKEYNNKYLQPALNATSPDNIILFCTVGAAWRANDTYEGLMDFLENTRKPALEQYMTGAQINIPASRLKIVPWVANEKDLGPEEFKRHQYAALPEDRFFRCQLVAVGGR